MPVGREPGIGLERPYGRCAPCAETAPASGASWRLVILRGIALRCRPVGFLKRSLHERVD